MLPIDGLLYFTYSVFFVVISKTHDNINSQMPKNFKDLSSVNKARIDLKFIINEIKNDQEALVRLSFSDCLE